MKYSTYSVTIIGSGIAGLYAALKLVENNDGRQILLVTKSTIGESNSRYAQGGIVGVLPENKLDSVELHVNDTLKAGAGLTDTEVAKFISENSSEAIRDLIKYGVEFDKDLDNKYALTLEAAHSVNRILHAGGDATGKSIELALLSLVEKNPNITIYQKTQAVDLLVDSNKVCRGLITFNTITEEYEAVFSAATIVATGGIGQVYSNTTNPKIATGDGIALGYRANAVIQDMEFVQFHPTALTLQENETRFLISESVRGEGAVLRNLNGERFTSKYDSRGDLAPRDIVTRSIFFEMQETNTPHVLLDVSTINKDRLHKRFPNIIRVCKENGIDIFKESIPVSPAAHYTMGGIQVSVNGATSIPGLFAIGEASCTHLHGANRLASNSLLECVVIAKETSRYLNTLNLESSVCKDSKVWNLIDKYKADIQPLDVNVSDLYSYLKHLMWNNAGIIRNEKLLSNALFEINKLKQLFKRDFRCSNIEEYEFRNLLIIAELVVKSAISRRESRGAHFRSDYPDTDLNAYHSNIKKEDMAVRNVLSIA